MMKKILLFSALIALLGSCGEDDPKPVVDSGPAVPEQKYNALLLMGTSTQNPVSAANEAVRLQTLHEYAGRVNTLNMVTNSLGPIYEPDGDTIMMNFQSPGSPFLVIDGTDVMLTELMDETKFALRNKPLLAVTNSVSQNDTAWIIDHKVKFFMDTISDEIYIDTYMLGTSKAREYETAIPNVVFDMKMAATPKLISNPGNPIPKESQWDLDVYSVDSSKVLAAKGSPFYYQNMFMDKFDSTGTWGYSLADYWPFGGEFYKGDIIGTKDTPIRHYFKKFTSEGAASPDFVANMELRFMSIVWVRDNVTGSFVHGNSFVSTATFKVK